MQGELPTRNHLVWMAIANSIEYFRFVEKLVRPAATAGHESKTPKVDQTRGIFLMDWQT